MYINAMLSSPNSHTVISGISGLYEGVEGKEGCWRVLEEAIVQEGGPLRVEVVFKATIL